MNMKWENRPKNRYQEERRRENERKGKEERKPLEIRESKIMYSLQTPQSKAEQDKAKRYTWPITRRSLNPDLFFLRLIPKRTPQHSAKRTRNTHPCWTPTNSWYLRLPSSTPNRFSTERFRLGSSFHFPPALCFHSLKKKERNPSYNNFFCLLWFRLMINYKWRRIGVSCPNLIAVDGAVPALEKLIANDSLAHQVSP